MRHWIVGAILWGVSVSAIGGLRAEQIQPECSLASRLNWAEFRVVRGRIVACNPRVFKSRTESAESSSTGCREVFALTEPGCSPSLHYHRLDRDFRLEIEFRNGRQVRIRQWPTGEREETAVEYHQPAEGPVRLETVRGGVREVYEAESFWHLAVAQPQLCCEHLMPALHRLDPDWELDRQLQQVESAMLELARSDWVPQVSQWRQWVGQLGSDDFAARRAADRRLRDAGQAVLPFLDSLDVSRLDSEQRARIRRIIDELTRNDGDDARRVAVWLSVQPDAWVRQLADADAQRRSLAAHRLALLRGRPVEFDPHAEPELRQRQIRKLRDALAAE